MREREDLGGVCERHRPFSRGIEGVEQEDEESYQTEMRFAAGWYVETHAGGQKRPEHLRKGKDEETTAPEGVDCPHGGPGEDKVNKTEAPCCKKGGYVAGASLLEDGGRIEGNDIDYSANRTLDLTHVGKRTHVRLLLTTAHLLSNHDNTRGLNCTTISWNGKQFETASEEVVSLCESLLFNKHFFGNQLSMDVV